MAEDNKNAFDYYNAEPPREGAVLPPEEAAYSAPADEYNEKVHGAENAKHSSASARSVALALAVGSLALSFVISAGGNLPGPNVVPTASVTVSETTMPDNSKPSESVTETSAAPTPTPTPTPVPTPVPLPTEDLGVRLDSFQMYQVNKGFLAEIKFTLNTNSGIDVTSVSGALDAKLFKYDGYNVKKRKMKYHYEKFHHDFSMDTACISAGEGPVSTEKQYTYMFNVPVDAISEDKFNVTLTVSNTLNGEKTEDKTVTLNNVAIWNEKTDSYAACMYSIKLTHNSDKSFDVTFTPKYDNIPVTNPKIAGIYVLSKKGTSYFTDKNFNVTYKGNTAHIAFKKPKKAPKNGSISFSTYMSFEVTDSTGKKFTDLCMGRLSKKF